MPRPPGGFTFHRLDEGDLELLHQWLNTPHVLEWWDRPGPTLDEVRTKYLPRVIGVSDVTPYIIRQDEAPIGYIQAYPVREGSWGLPETHAAVGLDLFIGDIRRLHRGLGPRILRQFVRKIVFRDEAIETCLVDPSPRNRIAIRAYEKAGFRYVAAGTDPDTGLEVYLMQITRDALERCD